MTRTPHVARNLETLVCSSRISYETASVINTFGQLFINRITEETSVSASVTVIEISQWISISHREEDADAILYSERHTAYDDGRMLDRRQRSAGVLSPTRPQVPQGRRFDGDAVLGRV